MPKPPAFSGAFDVMQQKVTRQEPFLTAVGSVVL